VFERPADVKPAVVLSCHTIGLAVIRALGREGVPVWAVSYDQNDMGQVSRYVAGKVLSCHPERSEREYVDLLAGLGQKLGRGVLIPADDATISVVSRHKQELERYYVVACPDWTVTEKFINKPFTYRLAEDIGIPVPKTLTPTSREEVADYAGSAQFPCLVKPNQSHRYYEVLRKKLVRADDPAGLIRAYDEAVTIGLDVMIQEYIPGPDSNGVNYNSYFLNGEQLVEFTAQKVRLSPPQFGVPRVVVSRRVKQVVENGRRILKAMGFYGFSCVEFKMDSRDGTYKLLEVNGRHNRSALLALRCGINFPLIEYNHLAKGELPTHRDYREGIYWIDEFRDVYESICRFKEERYGLRAYLQPYLDENVFSIFSWKDPLPFVKRFRDLAISAVSTI
jgi:predicted ATP-grasp superfamily ATP-dependent carboligase